jgi:hypothetical protein
MILSLRWLVTSVVLVVAASAAALAQDEPAEDKLELAKFLDDARLYRVQVGRELRTAQLREPPLLNFTNPERNQERGSVFVWLLDERPVVLGQFFRYNSRSGRNTKHAFHSLADTSVEATYENQLAWAPNTPGVTWNWLKDAPEPAESSRGRLLQMRQLARRFKLTLTNPKNESTELRLMPRPLLEYAAPKQGVHDGVLLSYVVATDPETILIMEAAQDGSVLRFRYAFARFHFQQLTATDGDTEVWRVDYDPTQMRNSPGDPVSLRKPYSSFVR